MIKRKIGLIALITTLAVIMVACGTAKKSATTASSEAQTATKTLTIKDSEEEVEVPVNPSKVVVFDMGSLDTIKALGHSDKVVGIAKDSLPAYLSSFKDVESAGGIKEPDLEKINALKPDLIIISGRQADFKKELSQIAPTIFLAVDGSDTWNSTKGNILTLAKIFDEEKLANEKIKTLETEIATVKEKAEASKFKALITLVNEGQLSAYGEGSRFGIIHDAFGFAQADDKIEASTHGQSVSFEYVLEKNPDVMFVVDRTKAIGGDDEKNNVADNELVAKTEAGKNKRVISLTPDVWYLSGGGIECTELMLQDVSQVLN